MSMGGSLSITAKIRPAAAVAEAKAATHGPTWPRALAPDASSLQTLGERLRHHHNDKVGERVPVMMVKNVVIASPPEKCLQSQMG